ncbi:MAG TPA: hypothetical protein VK157_08920 [Phycisphaerales bacterium]|nr:hypothetical protein [Phycisphaerales bacterium]
MHETPPHAPAPSPQAVPIWTSSGHGVEYSSIILARANLSGLVLGVLLVWAVLAFERMTYQVIALAALLVIALSIMLAVGAHRRRSHIRRVTIDDAARVVYFENVYLHQAWRLPQRMQCIACSFDDILWIDYWKFGHPKHLLIATRRGKVLLSSERNDLGPIHDALHTLTRGRSVPVNLSPWLLYAILCACVLAGVAFLFYMNWVP